MSQSGRSTPRGEASVGLPEAGPTQQSPAEQLLPSHNGHESLHDEPPDWMMEDILMCNEQRHDRAVASLTRMEPPKKKPSHGAFLARGKDGKLLRTQSCEQTVPYHHFQAQMRQSFRRGPSAILVASEKRPPSRGRPTTAPAFVDTVHTLPRPGTAPALSDGGAQTRTSTGSTWQSRGAGSSLGATSTRPRTQEGTSTAWRGEAPRECAHTASVAGHGHRRQSKMSHTRLRPHLVGPDEEVTARLRNGRLVSIAGMTTSKSGANGTFPATPALGSATAAARMGRRASLGRPGRRNSIGAVGTLGDVGGGRRPQTAPAQSSTKSLRELELVPADVLAVTHVQAPTWTEPATSGSDALQQSLSSSVTEVWFNEQQEDPVTGPPATSTPTTPAPDRTGVSFRSPATSVDDESGEAGPARPFEFETMAALRLRTKLWNRRQERRQIAALERREHLHNAKLKRTEQLLMRHEQIKEQAERDREYARRQQQLLLAVIQVTWMRQFSTRFGMLRQGHIERKHGYAAAVMVQAVWKRRFCIKMFDLLAAIRRLKSIRFRLSIRIWRKTFYARLLRTFFREHNNSYAWTIKKYVQKVKYAQRVMREFVYVHQRRMWLLEVRWVEAERKLRNKIVAEEEERFLARQVMLMKRYESAQKEFAVAKRWNFVKGRADKVISKVMELEEKMVGFDPDAPSLARPSRGEHMRREANFATWKSTLHSLTPADTRKEKIRTWLRRCRWQHIDTVKTAQRRARRGAVDERDARNLLVGGAEAARVVNLKQMQTYRAPEFPPMCMLRGLRTLNKPIFHQFFENIRQAVREDVLAKLGQLVESGHAVSVIKRYMQQEAETQANATG